MCLKNLEAALRELRRDYPRTNLDALPLIAVHEDPSMKNYKDTVTRVCVIDSRVTIFIG